MRAIFRFLQRDLGERITRVIFSAHFLLSGVLGFVLVFPEVILCGMSLKISKNLIYDKMIDYNVTIFGFSVAAIAIIISLPKGQYLNFLTRGLKTDKTPLHDILFILTWTSFVHVIAFFYILVLSVGFDHREGEQIIHQQMSIIVKIIYGLYFWIQIYSCIQFLVTLISVYQVSRLYATSLTHESASGSQ